MQGKLSEIIKKGYLPQELPPTFTTESLVSILPSIRKLLNQLEDRQSDCVKHSIPKRGRKRRTVYIPNPRQQIQLARALALLLPYYSNKEDMQNNYKSFSKVSLAKTRAFKPASNFFDMQLSRVHLSTGSAYLLQLDIEEYYESMSIKHIERVLESIPTKTGIVANPTLNKNNITNLLMNTNSGRRYGIPVGPDTSFLISEILGSAIDKKIWEKIPGVKGLRYVDDFYFYVENEVEAERIALIIKEILLSFDLQLNQAKQTMQPLPDRIFSSWSMDFKSFDHNKKGVKDQMLELIRYFDDAAALFHRYPTENVLYVAVSRISRLYVYKENWRIYESFLLRASISDPKTLSLICRIFYTYADDFMYELDKGKISESLSLIITKFSAAGSGYETAWAIWTCISLDIKISNAAAQSISQMDDPIVALLALDMLKRGLIPGNGQELKARWRKRMTSNDLYGPYWILAYEASIKGWLKSDNDYIGEDNFFSLLRDRDVSFYSTDPVQYYLNIPLPDEIDEELMEENSDDIFLFEY